MKTCNKCKETKEMTEFFKDKANLTDGHYSICKSCKTASTMKWRAANREHYNSIHKKYSYENYSRLRLLRYKLNPETYANMLAEQKGVCAICNKAPNHKRPLVIDHEHSTGKVRGLLCYKCNRDMHVLDNDEHYNKLLDYKKKTE